MSSIYKPGSTQEKPTAARSLGKGRKSQQPQPDSLTRLSAPYDDDDNLNGITPTKCKNDSVTKPMHSEIDSLYQSTDQGGKGPQNILYQSRDVAAVGSSLQSANLTEYCRNSAIEQ